MTQQQAARELQQVAIKAIQDLEQLAQLGGHNWGNHCSTLIHTVENAANDAIAELNTTKGANVTKKGE